LTPEAAFREISRDPSHKPGWEAIYSFLQPRLLGYVSSLLVTFRQSPDESAEDVVHEALLVVLDHWNKRSLKLGSVTELERYLKRVCRNHLIDRYRHDQSAARLLDFLALTFDRAFDADTALQRKIFLEQVIARLPEECARMLTRFVRDDVTPAELADEENASPATFYTRWYRCLQKARPFLSEAKSSPG
jgi:RNA polymerase sigma factor (sigma-70 family)